MTAGNSGSEADYLVERTISEQVRQALLQNPNLTTAELKPFVDATSEQVSRCVHDLKSHGVLTSVKDAESGRFRYSIAEGTDNSAHRVRRQQNAAIAPVKA